MSHNEWTIEKQIVYDKIIKFSHAFSQNRLPCLITKLICQKYTKTSLELLTLYVNTNDIGVFHLEGLGPTFNFPKLHPKDTASCCVTFRSNLIFGTMAPSAFPIFYKVLMTLSPYLNPVYSFTYLHRIPSTRKLLTDFVIIRLRA